MQLLSLWLERFYEQQAFELHFAEDHRRAPRLRFVVGPNGVGKSRLLEALARIFSNLSVGLGPEIGFELHYRLGGREVLLTTRAATVERLLEGPAPPRLERVEIWLLTSEERGMWRMASEWPSTLDGVLPNRVVTMSSGPVSRLGWAVGRSREERLRREIASRLAELDDERQAPESAGADLDAYEDQLLDTLRSQLAELWDATTVVETQPGDLPLAALAALAHPQCEQELIEQLVLGRARLRAPTPLVAFVLDLAPDWRRRVSRWQRATLERLEPAAARRVVRSLPGAADSEGQSPSELSFVFALDARLRALLGSVAHSPQILFEQLLTYRRCGALRDVRLLLAQTDGDDLLLDDELSDGEFLLLGRYALLLLYRSVGASLLLLDEPETHFNDRWKVALVSDIERIMPPALEQASEVVIATHSDLTLTDAEWQDVYLMAQLDSHDGGGTVEPARPGVSPLAADRRVIAREVFGVDDGIGRRGLRVVADALEDEDPARVEDQIARLGPGFGRFRVTHHLRELREGDDDGDAA